MMLDIIMCITFLLCKINTKLFILSARILEKRYIDNGNVQVADEIIRDICKYLV